MLIRDKVPPRFRSHFCFVSRSLSPWRGHSATSKSRFRPNPKKTTQSSPQARPGGKETLGDLQTRLLTQEMHFNSKCQIE